jgi:hypothetical protein
MAIFVCQEHVAEFCKPDGHTLISLEDGLEEAIRQAEMCRDMSISAVQRYKDQAESYKAHLKHIGLWERKK